MYLCVAKNHVKCSILCLQEIAEGALRKTYKELHAYAAVSAVTDSSRSQPVLVPHSAHDLFIICQNIISPFQDCLAQKMHSR